MNSSNQNSSTKQTVFTRQATILRKNLMEWDRAMRGRMPEDWPTMMGRVNAALNQSANLDRSIEDVWEHFVYLPQQTTANPQDIPFFLSTRLENMTESQQGKDNEAEGATASATQLSNSVKRLASYEKRAAETVAEYEETMVRF